MTDPPTGISALTLASVLLSVESPSINTTRFAMAWRSIESRLWARMSISMPTTLPLPMSSRIDAMNSTEPPRATPVSTMRSGLVAQMISWVAIMSAGSCMMGTPIQLQR